MVMDEIKMSDADALLSALASPSGGTGPVLSTKLDETTPASPVPGGAIQALQVSAPVNAATVETTATGGIDLKALLWIGGGIGTAWLLSRSDSTVSGKKQNWLVPALILGAGAAWFLFGDKLTSGPAAAANSEKDWLLNTFHASNEPNQAAMLAAIPNMTDADLHWLYVAAHNLATGGNLSAADTDAINTMMTKYGLRGL